jgi:hypothetical protein
MVGLKSRSAMVAQPPKPVKRWEVQDAVLKDHVVPAPSSGYFEAAQACIILSCGIACAWECRMTMVTTLARASC